MKSDANLRPGTLFLLGASMLLALDGCGNDGTSPFNPSPAKGYLYVTSADDNIPQAPGAVFQYAISADGSLSALGQVSVPTGAGPRAIVSAGSDVYVANQQDATISQYTVSQGGSLQPLSPASVPITGPYSQVGGYSLTMTPAGCLYVVATPLMQGQSVFVAGYTVNGNGTLSPSPTYTTVPATVAGALTPDFQGKYVYLPAGANVYQLAIQADCTLSLGAPVTVPGTAEAMTIALTEQTAYVLSACVDTNCDGQLETYQVGAAGALTPTGQTIPLGSHVIPLALVAKSSPAYLLANLMGVDTTTGLLLAYPLDSNDTIVSGTAPIQNMLTGAAVSVLVVGPDTYALTSNAAGVPIAMTGGQITHYQSTSAAPLGSTTLSAGRPTGMAVYVLPIPID